MKKIKKANLLFPRYLKIKTSPPKKVGHIRDNIYSYEMKQGMKYRPINPKRSFNPSTIGINEIIKKNNLSLITNNKIKNIIIKFREEKQKEIEEKKVLYKNKSYHDIEKEKNTHFLMLKALLRKDHQTIQNLIKRENKEIKKKENRCSSSRNFLYLNKRVRNKSAPKTLFFGNNFISTKNTNKTLYIKNTKKEIWKEDFLPKYQKNINNYTKKYELKIKSAYSISLGGKISSYKIINSHHKKFNQDINFSLLNIYSEKLGEISLFGIFDGNGPYGKQVAFAVKDYIIDYFKICKDMKVTLKRDNFYSIMYNSFTNAQKYLIENSTKLNLNLYYSGVSGCILLYPQNNTNKVYCANLGRNKCILYTMFGTIRLSYELYPQRASEKYRISLFKKKREKIELSNNNNEGQKTLNKNEEIILNNENKNNNINKELNKEKENINLKINENTKSQIDEKEKDTYLNDFLELDISRCVGNLIAEEKGVIPGPEVIESDIRISRGKYIVMGTDSLWKYLTENEVGEIVNKYLSSGDCTSACKELIEIAKERWKSDLGRYDDISVGIIIFDLKNLDVTK